ncbi:MAG: hypothetical protein ACE5Q6_16150 [Dehalococcoidia bacterium]
MLEEDRSIEKGETLRIKGSHGHRWTAIREVLHYLIEHRDAKDTLDGILKWWLPERQSNWRMDKVQKALDVLVLKGWLTERKVRSSKKIYGLNKDRLEEIKNFLRQSGNGSGMDKRNLYGAIQRMRH